SVERSLRQIKAIYVRLIGKSTTKRVYLIRFYVALTLNICTKYTTYMKLNTGKYSTLKPTQTSQKVYASTSITGVTRKRKRKTRLHVNKRSLCLTPFGVVGVCIRKRLMTQGKK